MRIRGCNIRLDLPSRGIRRFGLSVATAIAVALAAPTLARADAKNDPRATPRIDVPAQWAAALPQILSAQDIDLYRKAFAAQDVGNWAGADAALAKVKDRRLVGHVLADRYQHPTYYSGYSELAAWLKDYADHPDAGAIYQLALKRAPKKGAAPLRRPVFENLKAGWFGEEAPPDNALDESDEAVADAPSPPGQPLVGEQAGRAVGIKAQIDKRLKAGDLAGAEAVLRGRDIERLLSDGELDYLKARIAAGWFARGDDARALDLAAAAAKRSGPVVPRANWIAGVSLFTQQRYADAAVYFEALARTPSAQSSDIAAGAFWAARSYIRAHRPELFNSWALQAAQYPQTFYGLLAARTLSVEPALNTEPPLLSQADLDTLGRTAAGSRAFALIQTDERVRAARELARLLPTGGPSLMRAVLSIAIRGQMPFLAMRLGRELSDLDGKRYDSALYPVPPWRPANGFEIDPALVYAIMRQESAFNPKALSRAGARGLMQLMPATAAMLDGGRSFKGRAEDLYNPDLNLALAQKFIKQLLDTDPVNGDLIRLTAAYNGGPGNLIKWSGRTAQQGDRANDALLFIETVPAPETRQYVTRVLYNYWIYSQLLGQATPSLELLAAGKWPSYDGKESPNFAAPPPVLVAAPVAPSAAPGQPAPVAVAAAPVVTPAPAPITSTAITPALITDAARAAVNASTAATMPQVTPATPVATRLPAADTARLDDFRLPLAPSRQSAEPLLVLVSPPAPAVTTAPVGSSPALSPNVIPAALPALPRPPAARPGAAVPAKAIPVDAAVATPVKSAIKPGVARKTAHKGK